MNDGKDLRELMESAEDDLFQAVVDRMERLEAAEPGPEPPAEVLARWQAALDKLEPAPAPRSRRKLGLRIALAAAILAGLFLFGAHALQLLNWIEIQRETYTQIQAPPESTAEEIVSGWSGACLPSYVPEGYHMSHAMDGTDFKAIEYADTEGHRLVFYQYSDSSSVRIDTESAEKRTDCTINGRTAYLIQTEAAGTLYWTDGQQIFFLEYEPDCLDDAEAVNMAAHINRQK